MLNDPDSAVASNGVDDSMLIARAVDGDRRAFGILLGRHERALRYAITALTKHAADTDDVMQESAVKIWANLGALDDPARIRAWMIRIARREALRLVLARRHEIEVAEEHASVAGPEQRLEQLDARRQLHTAVGALSERQQRCFVLRELHGYSYREIADRLELAESTVRGSLASARRSVSRSLSPLRTDHVDPNSDLVPGSRRHRPSSVGSPIAPERRRAVEQSRAVASTSRTQSTRAGRQAVRVRVGTSGVPTVIAPERETATSAADTAAPRSSPPTHGPGRPPSDAR